MNQFFASGGQSIGVSASASVLPMNIQDWFSFGWTGWISLLSKGLKSLLQHHSSKASIIQHSAFFIVQLSHPYMTKVQDTNNRLCSSKAFALKHHIILPWKLVFPRVLDLSLGLYYCTLFLMVSTFTGSLPCLSFFWNQAHLTIQWLENYTWISHWHLNIILSRMHFAGLLLSLFLYSQWKQPMIPPFTRHPNQKPEFHPQLLPFSHSQHPINTSLSSLFNLLQPNCHSVWNKGSFLNATFSMIVPLWRTPQ